MLLFENPRFLKTRTGDCLQAFEVAEMERETDEEIRHLIARCFEEVFSLLVNHQDALVAMSAAILQNLTLEKKQLRRLVKEIEFKRGRRWKFRL